MSESPKGTQGAFPHTVIVETGRMEILADFYRRGLDLPEPKATGADHLGFSTETVYFGFDLVKPERATAPGPVSVWFEVDDLEKTFQRFVALGAEVSFPPTRKPWGAVLAAVLDPDGNTIGLSQRGKFPE
jgi:predicted enzyme related to lactoylglutathione lyase